MSETRTRRRPALERVVQTADRLFYEHGLHATGVDRIAAEANVSKATLYTYFATKDDLIAHYLRGRSTQWQKYLTEQLEVRSGSAVDRLLAVFDLLGVWFQSDGFRGCPFINAEAEAVTAPQILQVEVDHRAWVKGVFRRLLAEVGVAEPERTIPQMVLLYDGSMSNAQSEPEVDWVGAAKRTVLAIVAAETTCEREPSSAEADEASPTPGPGCKPTTGNDLGAK